MPAVVLSRIARLIRPVLLALVNAISPLVLLLSSLTLLSETRVVAVPVGKMAVGDLVFFEGGGHVGIYIGNGNFIHAPHTGDVVKISSLSWEGTITAVGRPR